MFTKVPIEKIRELLKEIAIEDYPEYILELKKDSRKGAIQLGEKLQIDYENYLKEINRMENLKKIENELYQNGYNLIAGIDEVGRGPLAGPVVSCAIILPIDSRILYIDDSKKLSPKKREELCEKIKEEAISISVKLVDENTIDRVNIYQATKQSMLDAVSNLNQKPDILLIDAMKLDTNIPQKMIYKGDSKCYSVAAASIVAKVTRDKLMEEYHEKYPEYNFKQNKGYGSKEHIEAIKKYGITPIHRKSFLKNILQTALHAEV